MIPALSLELLLRDAAEKAFGDKLTCEEQRSRSFLTPRAVLHGAFKHSYVELGSLHYVRILNSALFLRRCLR
jgi:hypothetical protein